MFISRKKYNELVEARDLWRNKALDLVVANDKLFDVLNRHLDNTEKIIDKFMNKEKGNDF